MRVERVDVRLPAEHGVICDYSGEYLGYFGWPSVARMDDGALVVAASGLRHAHVCPFGRTVLCKSADDGRTWTAPAVANDLPLDDRDAGVVSLGGARLLISWFTSDTRRYPSAHKLDAPRFMAGLARQTDAALARWLGSWVRLSADGGDTWGGCIRVPVTAPHGPIRLAGGALLYLGKQFGMDGQGAVAAYASADGGLTWDARGQVPLIPGTAPANYHEPHVVELGGGRLLGLIRMQNYAGAAPLEDAGLVHFSLAQTESGDGGATWSAMQPLGFHGSPPHLLAHSSGALVAVYGCRLAPFGQRAMLSYDRGQSWRYDYILRDDGPDGDLGYPASVELGDGSLLTVYYQKSRAASDRCSLLWSRWRLPA